MKKSVLITILLLAMLSTALFYLATSKKRVDPTQTITLIDGRQITFADLQGKPLLVVFWATSCTTCVQEMPKLAERYEKGNTEILAVAVQYDEEDKIRNYINQNGYQFKFTYDRDNSLSKLFENTVLTPTIYSIDKDGYIASKSVGTIDLVNDPQNYKESST